jgi:hypothetical protein
MEHNRYISHISISVDGAFAGDGKLIEGIICDCGAQFCEGNAESDDVYELIEEAIEEGKDSLKVETSERESAIQITWTITPPTSPDKA